MDAEQLVQLILLVCLAIERLLKNSKRCKSKCCCTELEQESMSPRAKSIEVTTVNKKDYTSEPSAGEVLPALEVVPQSV